MSVTLETDKSLSDQLRDALDYGFKSDLELKVGDQSLQVHKLIFGLSSKFFRTYRPDIYEVTTTNNVDLVRALVDYVYFGEISLKRGEVEELWKLGKELKFDFANKPPKEKAEVVSVPPATPQTVLAPAPTLTPMASIMVPVSQVIEVTPPNPVAKAGLKVMHPKVNPTLPKTGLTTTPQTLGSTQSSPSPRPQGSGKKTTPYSPWKDNNLTGPAMPSPSQPTNTNRKMTLAKEVTPEPSQQKKEASQQEKTPQQTREELIARAKRKLADTIGTLNAKRIKSEPRVPVENWEDQVPTSGQEQETTQSNMQDKLKQLKVNMKNIDLEQISCPLSWCTKIFVSPDALTNHLKEFHKFKMNTSNDSPSASSFTLTAPPKPKEEKKLLCKFEYCKKVFGATDKLLKHYMADHPKELTRVKTKQQVKVKCKCGKEFHSQAAQDCHFNAWCALNPNAVAKRALEAARAQNKAEEANRLQPPPVKEVYGDLKGEMAYHKEPAKRFIACFYQGCHMAFSAVDQLQRHIYKFNHDKMPRVGCNGNAEACRQADVSKTVEYSRHQYASHPVSARQVFNCFSCSQYFVNKESHFIEVHKVWLCQHICCHKHFKGHAHSELHKRSHKVKPDACTDCDKVVEMIRKVDPNYIRRKSTLATKSTVDVKPVSKAVVVQQSPKPTTPFVRKTPTVPHQGDGEKACLIMCVEPNCRTYFRTPLSLLSHVRQTKNHSEAEERICRENGCQQKFNTLFKYIKHLFQVHPKNVGQKGIACPTCHSCIFLTEDELEAHTKVRHPMKRRTMLLAKELKIPMGRIYMTCVFKNCGRALSADNPGASMNHWQMHVQNKDDEFDVACKTKCKFFELRHKANPESFDAIHEMTDHRAADHKLYATQTFSCTICKKIFITHYHLSQHISAMHKNHVVPAEKDKEKSEQLLYLEQHYAVTDELHMCPCGKKYPTLDEMLTCVHDGPTSPLAPNIEIDNCNDSIEEPAAAGPMITGAFSVGVKSFVCDIGACPALLSLEQRTYKSAQELESHRAQAHPTEAALAELSRLQTLPSTPPINIMCINPSCVAVCTGTADLVEHLKSHQVCLGFGRTFKGFTTVEALAEEWVSTHRGGGMSSQPPLAILPTIGAEIASVPVSPDPEFIVADMGPVESCQSSEVTSSGKSPLAANR